MRLTPALIIAGLTAAGHAAHAQVAYQLETGSTLTVVRCPAPCTCPPSQGGGPLTGVFTLTFDHQAGSYAYYNVQAAAWVADFGGTPVPVVGSGTYQVTSPIAFLHQMQLDLMVGTDTPRHFDSGEVSADVHHLFPSIGISLSTDVFDCTRYDLHLITRPAPPPVCYANCDASTTAPVLNALDFSCFLNKYAAGDTYANCDGSSTPPVLNVLDFSCFLNRFAAGCT